MNMSVLQRIPEKVRAGIYLALAIVALLLGALQVAEVRDLWGFPVLKALAVVGFLAAPFGAVAAANVSLTGGVDSPSMGAGYDDPVTDGELLPGDEAGESVSDIAVVLAIAVLVLVLLLAFVPVVA